MAGLAQVWLTEKELDALLRAAFDTKVKVSSHLADGLRDKLLVAFGGVACKVAVANHEPQTCHHEDVTEHWRKERETPTNWKCKRCGDLFPLIGDTDQWPPTTWDAELGVWAR